MSDSIRFPETFLWGAATSAYQVEGSPLADGAGPSIWHRFSHSPGRTAGGETGDVACDHSVRVEAEVVPQLARESDRLFAIRSDDHRAKAQRLGGAAQPLVQRRAGNLVRERFGEHVDEHLTGPKWEAERVGGRGDVDAAAFANMDQPFAGELPVGGENETMIGVELGDELTRAWQTIAGLQRADLKAAKDTTAKRLDDRRRAFLLRHRALGLWETTPTAGIDSDNIMAPVVRSRS